MSGGRNGFGCRVAMLWVVGVMLFTSLAITPAGADSGADFGTTKPGLRAIGDEIDRPIEYVRVFERWDAAFPDAEERLHLDQGRSLLLSIFPQRTDDSLVPWAAIAAAEPGSELYDDIVRWADRLAPFQDQLYITFNHEPEVAKNVALGTASEFRAAWQRVMSILADEGLQTLGRTFVVTSPSFDYPATDRRAFDRWYPGDEWVDAVGGDAYNFFDCRPAEPAGWRTLADLIEGQRRWGLTRPGIELMLPEFATVSDTGDPTRRAQWLSDVATTLADPAYDQFSLALYFYDFDAVNPGCDYLPSSDDDVQAFYDMAGDPALGGTPPGSSMPPTSCTAETIDGAVVIEWRPSFRAAGYELVRLAAGQDPLVVSSGPGLSFSETAVDGASYTVAAIDDDGGVSIAAPCSEPGPTAPPLGPPSNCEWARDEGFITVSWVSEPEATDYVVFRTVNGNGPYWRGRTADTELADTDRFANLTYEVRSRAIDGSLSSASTQCVDTSPPLGGLEDPEPPTDCAFLRQGGEIVVTWVPGQGAVDTIVARSVNGTGPYWRGRIAGSSFVDTDRPGEMNYLVRSRSGAGIESDSVTCVDETPPPEPLLPPTECTFTRLGGSITVSWEPGPGASDTVVYRTVDGNGPYWRTRTSETSFIDTDRNGTIDYSVVARDAAGSVSAATLCADLTPPID